MPLLRHGGSSAVSHPSYGFAGPFDDTTETFDAGDAGGGEDAPSLTPGDAGLDEGDAGP